MILNKMMDSFIVPHVTDGWSQMNKLYGHTIPAKEPYSEATKIVLGHDIRVTLSGTKFTKSDVIFVKKSDCVGWFAGDSDLMDRKISEEGFIKIEQL